MIQIGAKPSTLDEPIEHLMACHRRIEQRLDTLVSAGELFDAAPREALAAIAASFRFLDTNGVWHTEDEEASLFPRLRPRLSEPETVFVELLEDQHDEAERLYARLKNLASQLDSPGIPAQYAACAASLRALYREHIRSEDEILTVLARRSLSEGDLREIAAEMRTRRALP